MVSAQADVIWDFENGNDHGFALKGLKPGTLPSGGSAWTIGPPDQFDGQKPAVVEGCHVVGGVLQYGPCNDPFGAATGSRPYDFTNGRGQQSYLNTYNLSQWGDGLHTASNDQIATSPPVRLGEGAALTVWSFGGSSARHAPELDLDPAEGYTNNSCGVAVLSAEDGSLLASVFTPAGGGSGNMPAEYNLDLSTFAGQKVIVEVVDAFQGSWGWVAVDEIRITNAVALGAAPAQARDPNPPDEATDVPPDVVLSWTPGEFAPAVNGHRVYFSANFDDVNDGAAEADRAITSDPEFDTADLPFALDFGTTYYWRVDEVNDVTGWDRGNVWSFSAEPFVYSLSAEQITATASSTFAPGMGPENTINGSGLDADDLHSAEDTEMWQSAMGGGQPAWIQYEFDRAYKMYEMWVWNFNVTFEQWLGIGFKDVTIETSIDGVEWIVLGDYEFTQAPGEEGYAHDITIDLDGVMARYVRLTANTHWGTTVPQSGLSEVRFYHLPVHARDPQPANGETGVSPDTILTWRAGREAAVHDVFLGTDEAAVADGSSADATVTEASYDPDDLELGTTYYWKVNEVNEAESPATWQGDVWSFETAAYLVVDDFEGYDDDHENFNRIFQVWIDGAGYSQPEPGHSGNGSGALVGTNVAPWVERTKIHGGRQSMPLSYDNSVAPFYSEAGRTFETAQDWTASAVMSLSLWFYGVPDNGGQLYLKINDTKAVYDGDVGDIARAQWQPWNIDLSTAGGDLSSVTTLTIGIEGTDATGTVYIDDIRLYPQAPELITPTEPDAANLVARYTFDGNANDSSGNGHNGTIVGNITFENDPVRGQVVSLPGGDDQYISIEGVGISGTMPRTIACWAKADHRNIPNWTLIFGFTGTPDGAGGDGSHFNIGSLGGPGGVGAHCWGWEETIFSDEVALEWHHYAMTYDGTTIQYYGDGVLMDTDPGKSNVRDLSLSADRVHVGSRITQASSFPGRVDDAVIYDVELSPEEIASLAGRKEPMHKPF